eukprot:100229_1
MASILILFVLFAIRQIVTSSLKENFTPWEWDNPLGCSSDMDCSLNGKCNTNNGNCECRKGWKGIDCHILNLLLANKTSGYHYLNNTDNKNVSSWGGMAVYCEIDNLWHMLASEMRYHCGINSWLGNSQIIHAISSKPDGYYERKEIIWPLFSHEPDLIRGPNGEYIAYFTSCYYIGPPPVIAGYNGTCFCFDGSTPNTSTQCQPNNRNWNESLLTYMSYTIDITAGSSLWSKPVLIPSTSPLIDTNMAGVILTNGTFMGLYRDDKNDECHIVRADNWKDNTTYIEYLYQLGIGFDDPFVWLDKNEYFHVLVHGHGEGIHGFSLDGWSWYMNEVGTYPKYINFTDGSSEIFKDRARPHIIFDKDGITPIALTNGAKYYDGTSLYMDASYTALQPINH